MRCSFMSSGPCGPVDPVLARGRIRKDIRHELKFPYVLAPMERHAEEVVIV